MALGKLINQAKLVWGCAPANYTGSANTQEYICLKNYSDVTIIIQTGAIAGGVAAVTLNQATAVAGTGAKALAFDHMYSDEVAGGTLVKNTVTSDTFLLDTANKLYVIPVEVGLLDGTNGFDCISVAIATPGVADDYYSVLYILHGNRFNDPTPPSAIVD